ncbi:MAG: hypothetical protein Pg6B_10420 [Candidatus Azobacteroides pseudotrichonymphae]|nr:MAG: hypothetical protein Pg6B_10420 [Candidatus Azobacteroides pseudotrichonymphae]
MSVGESTLSGAGTGAAIGSAIMPGLGTAAGALVGAGAGALAGWYDNKYNSAAGQRKRLEEAGYNPNMQQIQQFPSQMGSSVMSGTQAGFAAAQQYKMQSAQIDNLKQTNLNLQAQNTLFSKAADKMEAETDNLKEQLGIYQNQKTLQEIEKHMKNIQTGILEQEVKIKQAEAFFANSKMAAELKNLRLEGAKIKALTAQIGAATTLAKKQALLVRLQSTQQMYDNHLKKIQVMSQKDPKWQKGVSYINDVLTIGNNVLKDIPIISYLVK